MLVTVINTGAQQIVQFKERLRKCCLDSLRHFYSTVIAKYLTEKEAAEYLGQRTYRGEYDHRKVVDKLKGDERMRQLSNEIF